MKKEEFFRLLKEELDLEGVIDENSSLNLSSLRVLSLMSFLDEHFNKRIKPVDLKNVDSVEKIIILIGEDKLL
jgi:acyl carrier protein